ncbi:MAG: hypothetical protein SPL08_04870 [Pseudomonadota bacterium]|nr:hypothetical protein [Pseudomonadota bacterium]
MKYLSFFFVLFFSIGLFADFLPQTDDIPLMDGIILDTTDNFSFDTPAGQILVIEGHTSKTAETIRSFYAKTLTALGWTRQGTDAYERGNDTVKLSFPTADTIRFDIMISN